ncbi:MAG TPA: hypothetical protein VEZ15_05830 [Acidimicrobiia bacterium]|nr:hypothetical protein [Acidimicrobiia bacterium]
MHPGGLVLVIVGAAGVGALHSVLPDHWVPLAVVARTQRWPLVRLAAVSALAAGGHVLTSVVLGGAIALVGLQFRHQVETQQGHIVGVVLVVTGVAFLVWGLTGHGHAHAHDDHSNHAHEHEHEHEHAHGETRHTHRHSHDAFVQHHAELIAERAASHTLAGRLTAVAVPFGVAASPDLTFLPFAVAASAYGGAAVVSVLVIFGAVTLCTFVGLTVIATAAGYQMRGEWLEKNANTITALVLIAIGVVAFIER